MADKFLIGMEKVLKRVDAIGFDSVSKRQIVRKAARPAANIIKDEVKSLIKPSSKFPYIDAVRRAVKAKVSKSRLRPGMNVLFNKNVDVPVSAGVGKEWWNIRGYAILTWFGNKDTRPRKHKTGKKRETGNVIGTTGYNPFELAKLNKGSRALIVFSKEIRKVIRKEFNKI